jgi:hypothetical protein
MSRRAAGHRWSPHRLEQIALRVVNPSTIMEPCSDRHAVQRLGRSKPSQSSAFSSRTPRAPRAPCGTPRPPTWHRVDPAAPTDLQKSGQFVSHPAMGVPDLLTVQQIAVRRK